MPVTATVLASPVGLSSDHRTVIFIGTLAITGNYAAGGMAADFQALCAGITTSKQPVHVAIQGIAGYVYEYDYTNKKIIIRAQTNAAAEDAPLGELTVAALPAGVTGDTIRARIVFPKV